MGIVCYRMGLVLMWLHMMVLLCVVVVVDVVRLCVVVVVVVQNVWHNFHVCRTHEAGHRNATAAASVHARLHVLVVMVVVLLLLLVLLLVEQLLISGRLPLHATLTALTSTPFAALRLRLGVEGGSGGRRGVRIGWCWFRDVADIGVVLLLMRIPCIRSGAGRLLLLMMMMLVLLCVCVGVFTRALIVMMVHLDRCGLGGWLIICTVVCDTVIRLASADRHRCRYGVTVYHADAGGGVDHVAVADRPPAAVGRHLNRE